MVIYSRAITRTRVSRRWVSATNSWANKCVRERIVFCLYLVVLRKKTESDLFFDGVRQASLRLHSHSLQPPAGTFSRIWLRTVIPTYSYRAYCTPNVKLLLQLAACCVCLARGAATIHTLLAAACVASLPTALFTMLAATLRSPMMVGVVFETLCALYC